MVKRPGCEAVPSPPSSAEIKEGVELYPHSTNTPSWRGAQLQRQLHLYLTFTSLFTGNERNLDKRSVQCSSILSCNYSFMGLYLFPTQPVHHNRNREDAERTGNQTFGTSKKFTCTQLEVPVSCRLWNEQTAHTLIMPVHSHITFTKKLRPD